MSVKKKTDGFTKMTESRKVFMENKMTKTRMTVEEIDSPLNSLFSQKISVHDKNFNQEPENNTKIKPSCRTRFGICPIINISKDFNTFNINVYFYFVKYKIFKKYMLLFSFCFGDAKRNKVTKKEKRRLRSALTVNLCNISFKKETGCAFNKVRWAQAAPLKPLAKSGALAPEPPCIHSLIHVLTKIFSETMLSVGWVFFLNTVYHHKDLYNVETNKQG